MAEETDWLRQVHHGNWMEPWGGGRCRGEHGTGYCEASVTTRRCGVDHAKHGVLWGSCPVRRTFCLHHGVTRWIERPNECGI